MIGIQGLESESVKNHSDSFRFRFRFLPMYTGGRIIAFRFKTVSDAFLFLHSHAIISFLGSRFDYLAH